MSFLYGFEPSRDYAFIDMKSFYASCELVSRGLHPLRDMLIVMSTTDNSSGLILASSPKAKEILGVRNVARKWDLPTEEENPAMKDLIVAPPRMNYYISVNLKIQEIVRRYAPPDDILWYSIDEGIVDLTRQLNYFVPGKMSRAKKLDIVSQMIQKDILRETGIFSTIGMSNSNPLLAKLALDNEAKKTHNMRALWNYSDVESKVWNIPNLDDFWGIGSRMKRNLESMNINSIKELANASPFRLHDRFGILGLQLYHHANGVDRTRLQKKYVPVEKSIGNSQVLPRDYNSYEMPLIIREMAEQVAIRLRRRGAKTTTVSLMIGYSKAEEKKGFNRQTKVSATDETNELANALLFLFEKFYTGGAIRNIGVNYTKLVFNTAIQLDLFENPLLQEKRRQIDSIMDEIRKKFGFTSIMRASSLLEQGRSLKRAQLVGGHQGGAGGLDGL